MRDALQGGRDRFLRACHPDARKTPRDLAHDDYASSLPKCVTYWQLGGRRSSHGRDPVFAALDDMHSSNAQGRGVAP
jgi:hypothetical protein